MLWNFESLELNRWLILFFLYVVFSDFILGIFLTLCYDFLNCVKSVDHLYLNCSAKNELPILWCFFGGKGVLSLSQWNVYHKWFKASPSRWLIGIGQIRETNVEDWGRILKIIVCKQTYLKSRLFSRWENFFLNKEVFKSFLKQTPT